MVLLVIHSWSMSYFPRCLIAAIAANGNFEAIAGWNSALMQPVYDS
jgi:hypothetical protein